MGLRELTNDQVHAVAAHLTAAEAIIQTALPITLLAEARRYRLQIGQSRKLVQVLSRRSTDWQLSDATRPLADDTEAVVFVDLSTSPPEFYPVPAPWLHADVSRRYEEFLARHGKTRPENPDSRHYAVHPSHVVLWHARWDVISDLSR